MAEVQELVELKLQELAALHELVEQEKLVGLKEFDLIWAESWYADNDDALDVWCEEWMDEFDSAEWHCDAHIRKRLLVGYSLQSSTSRP